MAPPFRIGVMQLTMEPLAEMLETAREPRPRRLRHDLARRGLPVVAQARHGGALVDGRLALMARDTERLTIAWGIISPYTRHPGAGRDGRARRPGGGRARPLHRRLRDVEDLPQQHEAGRPAEGDEAARAHARLGRDRARRASRASASSTTARCSAPTCRRCQPEAHAPDWDVPVYVAATAPLMQQLGGEIGDGLLTPSITTPAFVRYTRGNVATGAAKAGRDPGEVDIGCTIVASIDADRPRPRPRRRARDRRHVPREQVPEHPRLGRHAARPGRDRDGRARAGRRGDGARRPPRGEGAGDRLAARPLQADRRHARRTASARSRSTGRPAARTSCSSSGARTATSRSASSPSTSCRTSARERPADGR